MQAFFVPAWKMQGFIFSADRSDELNFIKKGKTI